MRDAFQFCATAGLAAMIAATAYAQSFTVRRAEVVVNNMPAQALAPPVALTAVGVHVPAGVVSTPPLRAHVRMAQSSARGRWTVVITDPAGNTERIEHNAPKVGSTGFWSDEFEGGPLRVAVVSADAGVQLEVDQIAIAIVASIPQAIVGADQRRSITDPAVPANVRQRGVGIARLKFMTAEGQGLCSGFLVGRDLLMTNEHCVANDEDARSVIVEFGFDSDASVPHRFRVVKVEATDFGLDYSLLRLSGRPPTRYRRLFISSAELVASNWLYIVQHPAGEPKQASFYPDCSAGDVTVAGRETAASDFGHLCDTLGGSSGSPVIDWSTGLVIGLHHLGFRDGIDKPQNQAVHIKEILKHLRTQVSAAIYNEVVRVQ